MHRVTVAPQPPNPFPNPNPQSLPPFFNDFVDRKQRIGYNPVSWAELSSLSYKESTTKNGLKTPPADDMNSTALHHYASQNSSYANYAGPTAVSRPYNAVNSYSRSQVPASSHYYDSSANSSSHMQSRSPRNSVSNTSLMPPEGLARRKSSTSNAIQPNLQIPRTVNNSGGSLAQFAAQLTCLFWFESPKVLDIAENFTEAMQYTTVQRLTRDAMPVTGFTKWVVTILSTTQVTQEVILLALLFIYRLKKNTPAVDGKSGSEYRLLTVALMLGNKFLDDNTYTNKTWAEVSGIACGEIHVMEVEFLSNMRYSLLATEKEWREWHVKLGNFARYFEKASKVQAHPTLPSPPASMESSPPHTSTPYNTTPYNYNSTLPHQHTQALISNLPPMPALDTQMYSRKRSHDENAEEPNAKRIARPTTAQLISQSMPANQANLPRLPVPNLSISTGQTTNGAYSSGAPYASQTGPVLPPLGGGRSLSSMYPSTPTYPPPSLLTPSGPSSATTLPRSQFGTPSRRHSPRTLHDLQNGSSPISASFPSHIQNNYSPSFFLQQRLSPYRPVRNVNTLLAPPPSSSMHNYHLPLEQMHYQPLGKRNDYRPGIVPDYQAQPGSYNPYASLPQPNFHG